MNFNQKTQRAQLSQGWGNNQHNRWQRQHRSSAPFKEPTVSAYLRGLIAAVLLGTAASACVVVVLMMIGG